MNKKVISGVLATSIILGATTPVFGFTKEENVYSNLKNNGEIKDTYVVNTFLLEKDEQITDYGDYINLRNLSGSEEIKIEDHKITLTGKEGKNYYQGTMQDKKVPWKIKINYYLDGKEIEAEDLAGKSGALEIKISIKQNKEVDNTFFENYLLQTTLSLDTEKCKNIQTTGATIANVSKNKQLTYTVLAGSEKDISIKADVTNFELPDGISFNGVLMSMVIDNFDTSVIQDKTALLKSGISKLNTGATKLKDGSIKYKSGIAELASKTKNLPSQSKQVQTGINQILSGVKTIQSKMASVQETSNNTAQVAIANQAKQVATKQATAQVTTQLTKLQQSEWYQQLDPATQAQIAASIKETAANTAEKTATSVATTTAKIVSDTYEESIKSVMNQLNVGLKEIETGLKTLSEKYTQLHEGLIKISSSIETLNTSYNEINKGITEIVKGTNTLNNNTKNIDSQIDDTIQEMLDRFENADYTPISFVSDKNKEVEAVQFVIKTEGISIKEETQIEEKQEENKGFWQKFVDLF